MKRQLYKIAKNLGISITGYNSSRSDLGTQIYTLTITSNSGGEPYTHYDSYFIGEASGKEKVVKYFTELCKEFVNDKNQTK